MLTGCSVSYAHYKKPDTPVAVDMIVFNKKAAFVELMEVVSENWHKAPTPELKTRVEGLIFAAGLVKKCANRVCWLEHMGVKIRTDSDNIIIEYSRGSIVKVSIAEPDRAANLIYG
jgi:hypothetical protein